MRFDVIFDIDGTIADCEQRRQYVQSKPPNWKAFNAAIPFDPPMQRTIDTILDMHHADWRIILCSGRGSENREITIDWLRKHRVPYDALYMRAVEDYRQDNIVKSELLDQILLDGYKPLMVFDDRQQVVDMWRDRGLIVHQVAPGDF